MKIQASALVLLASHSIAAFASQQQPTRVTCHVPNPYGESAKTTSFEFVSMPSTPEKGRATAVFHPAYAASTAMGIPDQDYKITFGHGGIESVCEFEGVFFSCFGDPRQIKITGVSDHNEYVFSRDQGGSNDYISLSHHTIRGVGSSNSYFEGTLNIAIGSLGGNWLFGDADNSTASEGGCGLH